MVEITSAHLQLVERVVRRYYPNTLNKSYEDLVSAGCVGLVRAAHRYNKSSGVSFETYAWLRIRGAIGDELRSLDHLNRTHRRKVNAGTAEDPGSPSQLLTGWHDAVDPDNQGVAFLNRDALFGALEHLPPRDAAMVRLCFLHDWTHRDVAKLFAVSQSRVAQIVGRSLRALRSELHDLWMDC